MEWEPGSDLVGDFTWPGFDSEIVVTGKVVQALRAGMVGGFEPGPVNIVGGVRRPGSRQKQVALPYTGPAIWELWVTTWKNLDPRRSTIEKEHGTGVDKLVGAESVQAVWDAQRGELVKRRHPRLAGHGLFVPFADGIFRVVEFPAWILCTDDVKRVVEGHAFTNVSFLEMGETS
jgi:hypothetical protein